MEMEERTEINHHVQRKKVYKRANVAKEQTKLLALYYEN